MSPVVKPEVTLSLPEDTSVIRCSLHSPTASQASRRMLATNSSPTPQSSIAESRRKVQPLRFINLFGDSGRPNPSASAAFGGIYSVSWRATSADDEKLRGTVRISWQKKPSPAILKQSRRPQTFGPDRSLGSRRLRGHYLTLKMRPTQITLQKETSTDTLVFRKEYDGAQQAIPPFRNEEMHRGLNDLLAIGVLRLGLETPAQVQTHHLVPVKSFTKRSPVAAANKHSLSASEAWSYALNTLAQTSVSKGCWVWCTPLPQLLHRHRFFIFSPALSSSATEQISLGVKWTCSALLMASFVIGE